MQTFGISKKFISWIKLIFGNASTTLNLNNNPRNIFKIERGARQGCPLAPYFFLIIGEILMHIIKKAVLEGRIRRITLLGWQKQQSIGHWAKEGDLSKLLGTLFGLNLNTPDIDQFLYAKIFKKLDYWSTMKLSLAGIVVICNHVFLSTLLFFNMVGGHK